MDKLVELIGKILEKLTSAKLIWTIIIAIAIFALIYVLSGSTLNIGSCFSGTCDTKTVVSALGLVAGSLIASAIIVWAAGLIKNKYFV
jgi:hypothetical protein